MKIPAIMLIFKAFVVVAPKGLRASHHGRSLLIPGSSYFLIARHKESQSFAWKMWNVAPQDQPVREFWFVWILLGPFNQHRSIQTLQNSFSWTQEVMPTTRPSWQTESPQDNKVTESTWWAWCSSPRTISAPLSVQLDPLLPTIIQYRLI